MLLRHDDRGVLAIGQPSHAFLSGQLARSWGNDRFPAAQPHDEVVLATDQHDVGWAMWDLEPTRDPETGLPYSFMELPLEEHLALWSAAPERLLTQSRYAALLVSMHGFRLYKRQNLEELPPDDAGAVRGYLESQLALQDRLSADFDPSLLAQNSQLIWTWDFLSLAICLDWAPRTVRDVPTVDGPVDVEITSVGAMLHLGPWPFADDAVSVRCEGRRLTGAYETDGALRAALVEAPWESVEFRLEPR
jgi:hypothetical protein